MNSDIIRYMKMGLKTTNKFTPVGKIKIPDHFYNRFMTGVEEIDEMFGEGILPGCCFTLTAQAGTGKTTMMLQILEALEEANYSTGYASGEEDETQLAYTCERLEIKRTGVANITDVDDLVESMKDLDVLVIDSFQALSSKQQMNTREFESYAVSQICNAAKEHLCSVFFIMHLTKGGKLKGSTLVPHSVDANIQLMHDENGSEHARIVSFYKNRFGATNDYEALMTAKGIQFGGRAENVGVKKSTNQKIAEEVLKMDPPTITKAKVMEEFEISGSKAYVILKDLQDRNLIEKFGRGANAIFKRTNVK